MPALLQGLPRWPAVGLARRAIVIGGGIAGLSAAYALRQAGFDAIVLERTARAGGRFLTCRELFDDQYCELGVTRIPESHALTLAYVRHFGLPLMPYPSRGTGQLYVVKDQRWKSFYQGACVYPEALLLTPHEKRLDAESLHHFYTAEMLTSVGSVDEPEWPRTAARSELFGQSFYDGLHRRGASLAAREICRAYDGTEIESFDAIGWLANMRRDTSGAVSLAIPGGNDRLTSALAAVLGDSVVTNAHVHRVHRSGSRITVGFTCGNRSQEVDAAVVVCAVPHRILTEIEFEPSLSSAKLTAAQAVPMLPVTRLNFQFSRRFWNLDEGLCGLMVACTTSPIERLWDLSLLQPGEHGILSAYVQNRNAELLDSLPSDEARIEYGLSILETFWPAARSYFLRGSSFSWQQPSTRGGWAVFLPGQLDLLPPLQAAEDGIHFAGDHTSLYAGWAQGALESAHCAVAEVVSSYA